MQLTGINLTEIAGNHSVWMNLAYNYTTGGNNGRIASMTDYVTSETVSYQYDSLNRLVTANSSGGWNTNYTYDGWGNLLNKGGSPGVPYLSTTVNPATNGADPSGFPYIAPTYYTNGLPFDSSPWDVAGHRVTDGQGTWYATDPFGRRLWTETPTNPAMNNPWTCKLMFYSIDGKRLMGFNGVYDASSGTPMMSVSPDTQNPYAPQQLSGTRQYFGNRLVQSDGNMMGIDRLGSVRSGTVGGWASYYPYGEDRTSTPNGQEKFGTYFRDPNGDDYAMARYYSSYGGRFGSADPTMDNVDQMNPGTWNAMAYVNGDPVNFGDPDGTVACGDLEIAGHNETVRDEVNANSSQGHFIDLVWHEAGFLSQAGGNVGAWVSEFEGIAQAIWDRYLLVQGVVQATGANGVVYGGANVGVLGYGAYGSSLDQVLVHAAAGTSVLNGSGQLVDNADTLQADLNEDQNFAYAAGKVQLAGSGPTVWVTQGCYSVIAAMESANGVAAGFNYTNGVFVTSWNSSPPINNPNYAAGIEVLFGNAGPTNFYGLKNVATGPGQRPRQPPKRAGRATKR
jgi:RHS repeat-associated protein